jgi:hypothetical protein
MYSFVNDLSEDSVLGAETCNQYGGLDGFDFQYLMALHQLQILFKVWLGFFVVVSAAAPLPPAANSDIVSTSWQGPLRFTSFPSHYLHIVISPQPVHTDPFIAPLHKPLLNCIFFCYLLQEKLFLWLL